jgi:hypothetical protein
MWQDMALSVKLCSAYSLAARAIRLDCPGCARAHSICDARAWEAAARGGVGWGAG